MTEGSFDDLARSIFDDFLSWEPAFATQVGWHKHDHKLKDLSPSAETQHAERLSELARNLSRIKTEDIEPDQAIDRDYAIHFLKLRIFELKEIKKNEKAAFAVAELGDSLFLLVAREHPPFSQRLEAITSRLEAAPKFLDGSKKAVTKPWRIWNEILIETGERMPEFLGEIRDHFGTRAESNGSRSRLNRAVKDATDAVTDYCRWMRTEILPNSFDVSFIGVELYRRYLEMLGYGVTPEENLSIAERYLQEIDRRKGEVAISITGSQKALDAVKRLRSDHAADFGKVLEEYRTSCLKAREYVMDKKLMTLPEGEELKVIETPAYMRHIISSAAQYEAGKFDNDRSGLFLVTSDAGNPEVLEEHSHAGIVNTTVHEAYPGHHVHGVCANLNPSYIRILHQSPDFAEGWGLYCEEMMISQGYNEGASGRLTVLNDLGFRLARQIADVKLSTGRMSLKQAAELLMKETGTSAPAAIAEAKGMTISPTYSSSYFIGKLGVMQMLEDTQRALGSRFDLRFFHDSLIYSGCMTVPFMRRALGVRIKERFGADLGEPRESIYEYALRRLRR